MWYLFSQCHLSTTLTLYLDKKQETEKEKQVTELTLLCYNTIEEASSNFQLSSTVFFIPQPVAVDGCTLELNWKSIIGAGVAVICEIQDIAVQHRSAGHNLVFHIAVCVDVHFQIAMGVGHSNKQQEAAAIWP